MAAVFRDMHVPGGPGKNVKLLEEIIWKGYSCSFKTFTISIKIAVTICKCVFDVYDLCSMCVILNFQLFECLEYQILCNVFALTNSKSLQVMT